jgi:NADPH:quinone reductase-like Zn-dependent oxidoreductase
MAVQLAVASGATVVATASSKNHEFVKSLGATAVVDYKSENVIQELINAIKSAGGDFLGALDAIGDDLVWRLCGDVVTGLGCGRVVSNNPRIPVEDIPEGLEVLGGKLSLFFFPCGARRWL